MIPNQIQELVDVMDPEPAALALAGMLSKLFPLLKEEIRLKLVGDLIGTPSDEKLASLVQL